LIPFFLNLYRFIRTIARGFKDPEFRSLLFLVAFILLSGTFFYHGAEHFSWLDSFYFSVTTLTTVGYGDLTPHTGVGKIFTIIYIFVGLGIILGFITAIANQARKSDDLKLENLFKHKK
jgi:uncharacterized membrane protein YphA (DoxX/SURF4 family)